MMSFGRPDPRGKGERQKFNRKRDLNWPRKSVVTDGKGNITSRPVQKTLPCFGDLIEWLMGRGDEQHVWRDNDPEPRGCAGCKVAAFCAIVAWERINSQPEIIAAHDHWESSSHHLDFEQRYKTPEWAALVSAINRHEWTDSNDEELRLDQERRQLESIEKQSKKPKKKRPPRPKPKALSEKMRQAIQEHRDARLRELLRLRDQADAPLTIRNRSPERLVLMADAWQAREELIEERRPYSGRSVFDRLQETDKIPKDSPVTLIKRIEEILKRVDEFQADGTWPLFDPFNESAPKPYGHGFHPDAIFDLTDPAD